jgi:hypothetical protein
MTMIHVRFEGRSYDIDVRALGMRADMRDAEIKVLVARHLDIAVDRLNGSVIDRGPDGAVIVRPEAVYG